MIFLNLAWIGSRESRWLCSVPCKFCDIFDGWHFFFSRFWATNIWGRQKLHFQAPPALEQLLYGNGELWYPSKHLHRPLCCLSGCGLGTTGQVGLRPRSRTNAWFLWIYAENDSRPPLRRRAGSSSPPSRWLPLSRRGGPPPLRRRGSLSAAAVAPSPPSRRLPSPPSRRRGARRCDGWEGARATADWGSCRDGREGPPRCWEREPPRRYGYHERRDAERREPRRAMDTIAPYSHRIVVRAPAELGNGVSVDPRCLLLRIWKNRSVSHKKYHRIC